MTIFYSWQSDIKDQRNEIEKRLNSIIKDFKKDLALEISLDRDTKGLSGSIDIVESIFKKIDSCRIFIADISFIGELKKEKIANQNVLLELGYAIRKIGLENIILLFNAQFGKIEELPFDIRKNRILSFNDYEELNRDLKDAIKRILNSSFSTIPNRDADEIHDMELFKELMKIFPEEKYMSFLDNFYYTRRYKRSDSDFFDETVIFSKKPKCCFLNIIVNELFKNFIKSIDSFRWFIAKETFPMETNDDYNELKDFRDIKDCIERDNYFNELMSELTGKIQNVEDSFSKFRKAVVRELRI